MAFALLAAFRMTLLGEHRSELRKEYRKSDSLALLKERPSLQSGDFPFASFNRIE